MFKLFYRWKEDFKASRRGERRVAPGMRGRVYARPDNQEQDNIKRSSHEPTLKVGAKVTRADGSVENYNIIDGKAVRE